MKKPTPKFVYTSQQKVEDKSDREKGPFVVVRLYENNERAPVEETEHEFSEDAWARAMKLNRAAGISSRQCREFELTVHRNELERKRQDQVREMMRRQTEEEEKRRREREEAIARGCPAGRSPKSVDEDKDYERVHECDGHTWPASVQHVVRHKPTDSLWSCRYSIRDDDSDYDVGQHWEQVERKTKTVVVYEPTKERDE